MHPEVQEHISSFPKETQEKLMQLRQYILNSVPELTECKSYGIPTFKKNGKNFIHYAGYAKHIGLYPGSRPIKALSEELKPYKHAKGSIQFPMDQDLPFDLIGKIIHEILNDTKKKP